LSVENPIHLAIKVEDRNMEALPGRPAFDYSEWSNVHAFYAEPVPLCAEQEAELDALRAEYDRLRDGDDAADDDGGDAAAGDHDDRRHTDDDDQRLDDLLGRIDEIEDRETTHRCQSPGEKVGMNLPSRRARELWSIC
jgi:hypothetical protein